MSKTLWQKLYKLHIYLGVFLALHIVIFSVSGALLLFKPGGPEAKSENKVLQNKKAPFDLAQALGQGKKELVQKNSKAKILALYPNDDSPYVWTFRWRDDGKKELRGSTKTSFDLQSLNFANQTQKVQEEDFWEWLLVLHRELFLGTWGKIYLGCIGLLYVFMLMSGWILYGRFMKLKNFGQIRRTDIFKMVDLHKLLGSLSFAWSLVVAVSGVFLAFNGVLIKIFQWQTLKRLNLKYAVTKSQEAMEIGSVSELIKSVKAISPEAKIEYISYPNTEFGLPGQFLVLTEKLTSYSQSMIEVLVLNAKTVELTERVDLPFFLKLVFYSEPLHFADYGGLFFKLMWLAFSLMSLALVVLGVSSFVLKRERRRIKIHPQDRRPQKRKASSYWATYKIPATVSVICLLAILGSLFLSFWPYNFLRFFLLIVPLVLLGILLKSLKK